MLHSTLPRAFLAPGLNYLGYYGDQVHHPYAAPTTWHIPMEDPGPGYSRLSEHHPLQATWETSRSATPCPLDLSLKPPAVSCTTRSLDLDDKADSERTRDGTPKRLENGPVYERCSDDETLLVDGSDSCSRSASAHSHYSSEQVLLTKEPILQLREAVEKTRAEEIERLTLYPGTDCGSQKYPLHPQKLVLTSPTQTVQNYHQQLLLTPQHHLQNVHAPMTPPSTPSPPQCPRRRPREEGAVSPASTPGGRSTPRQASTSTNHTEKPSPRPKKKHARRLKFDEDTSSPVSGTVILGPDEAVVTGDIDPAFNIVEITEEARTELAKIENRLGPYQCKLCRQLHEDAFQLAQHRCSRIAHVEYRCPECDKRFSCPANLASHRRWHKPRIPSGENAATSSVTSNGGDIPCTRCDAKFSRQAALRKHLATQHPEANNNNVLMVESQESLGKSNPGRLSSESNFPAEVA